MAVDLRNLEWVRSLMSEKSTSNFAVGGSGECDKSDASGCLAYINLSYKGNDKELMKVAVDCYVGLESKQKLSEKLAGVADATYTPKMAKKYSKTMGEIVAEELVGITTNDKQKAKKIGVNKSTYSRIHADVFDEVMWRGMCVLVDADDMAGRYIRQDKKA